MTWLDFNAIRLHSCPLCILSHCIMPVTSHSDRNQPSPFGEANPRIQCHLRAQLSRTGEKGDIQNAWKVQNSIRVGGRPQLGQNCQRESEWQREEKGVGGLGLGHLKGFFFFDHRR